MSVMFVILKSNFFIVVHLLILMAFSDLHPPKLSYSSSVS